MEHTTELQKQKEPGRQIVFNSTWSPAGVLLAKSQPVLYNSWRKENTIYADRFFAGLRGRASLLGCMAAEA
jgi:hypothetical protein